MLKWTMDRSPPLRERAVGMMKPMMAYLFPRLLPGMMPKLMPDMLPYLIPKLEVYLSE